MGWIFVSIVPVILGLILFFRARPANQGKKKALKAFTIAYPTAAINSVVFTAFAMVGVVALTAYRAPALLQQCSVYYLVYVLLIGFVVALALVLGNRSISFNGEKISYTPLPFKKPIEFSTAELAQLDVRKTEVRVLKEDGSLMFSAGVMMENLDLFFAWTHERPNIKLTLNGKELPKKGGKQ